MRIFSKISPRQKQNFYKLVHEEWNENFEEIEQKFTPKIWIAIENKKNVAGLAIFEKNAPETEKYPDLVKKLFSENFFYLGYFVVDEKHRGQGLGSEFLQKILKKITPQKVWLSIENPKLQKFYEKNGFKLVKEIGGEKILKSTNNKITQKKHEKLACNLN